MARNSGKASESDFEGIWARQGKQAYVYRLVDAAEIKGRTGEIGHARPQPSDYVLVYDGQTEFAEVKSSRDKTAFRFSLLRPKQSASAVMILSAGGSYFVYAESLAHGCWYRFPYSLVEEVKKLGKASIPWADLEGYKWIF